MTMVNNSSVQQEHAISPPAASGSGVYQGCSARAVAVGLIAAAFMAVAIPYGDMVLKGSQMGIWNTNPASIFLFFVIVAILNVIAGTLHRGLALDRSELAVVYIMLLVANTLPARGFSGYLPPVATGAFYYASPENNWKELIHPFLPRWAVIDDEAAVVRFYEGDLDNPTIPWDQWVGPIVYWILFAFALYLVMVSVSVILRKQWVEHERLVYPMMQLPLHMLQEDGSASRLGPFFKQRSVWIGFALPCIIVCLNGLHHYFAQFPSVDTVVGQLSLLRGTISVQFYLSFTMIGFSYLISRNVGASLCFFYLLGLVEKGILGILGISIDAGPVGAYGHYAVPIMMYQAMGAMIVLVLMGLWTARHHLLQVARRTLAGAEEVDDAGEMMSCRQAVLGLLFGLLVMGIWLGRAGMPPLAIGLLFCGCFVVFLTITRVVVEGGVAVMFPPMVGPDFAASALGTRFLGPFGGSGMAMTYVWGTDPLVLLMTSCSNGLKLADLIGRRLRRLFWAIVATIVVTIVLSLWMRLDAAYTHGAINLNRYYAENAAQYPYRFLHDVVTSPVGPHVDGLVQMAGGGVTMLLLGLAHYRWVWWPFHPLGFPISSAFGQMWFSVLIAMLVKSTVLKYGGALLYRRTTPFFLGLILGEIVTAGFWLIIDFCTGTQGNILGSFLN